MPHNRIAPKPVSPNAVNGTNGKVLPLQLPVVPSNAPLSTKEPAPQVVKYQRTKLRGPGRFSLDTNKSYRVPASDRSGAVVINQHASAWLTIQNDKGDKVFDIPPTQAFAIPSNDEFTILNDGTGATITLNLCLIDNA